MSLQTVKQFIAAINRQDVEGIYALMHDDHVFVDSQGNKLSGKDTMKEGWQGYFSWFIKKLTRRWPRPYIFYMAEA